MTGNNSDSEGELRIRVYEALINAIGDYEVCFGRDNTAAHLMASAIESLYCGNKTDSEIRTFVGETISQLMNFYRDELPKEN